jgi:hypothetical protein
MLARGEPLTAVLASHLGSDSAGRAALGQWLAFLGGFPTLHVRRQVLEHYLRTFERAELHGRQWRATGPSTYVGRQHELAPEMVEYLDPETGEFLTRESGKFVRKHVPARRAGALSASQRRSPRTLNRYRQSLRAARILASAQPPVGASDAATPRTGDGRWAYAQHWLVLPPTPEMLRRWRAFSARRKARPASRPVPAPLAPRADDLRALSRHAERED